MSCENGHHDWPMGGMLCYCGKERWDPDGETEYQTSEATRLRRKARHLHKILGQLVEWEQFMGGWEAPCWKAAKRAVRRGL